MKTATFDPASGPITAEVTCSNKREGSYTLFLWKGSTNDVVKEWRGNFLNPADDTYALPKPTKANNGRLVEALVTIARGPCEVALTISQGGAILARESVKVPKGAVGVSPDLFVRLEAQ